MTADNDTSRPTSSRRKNENIQEKDDTGGPREGDLIIRDGFPALRLPPPADDNGATPTTFRPMLEGDEPLPRHTFWSCERAVDFPHPGLLESLKRDCETVFTARDKPNGAAYSAGQTFFLPASHQPRCALEALAMTIFENHTAHLPKGTFDPATSGANWWTLVLDDEDNGTGAEATAGGGDDDDDPSNNASKKSAAAKVSEEAESNEEMEEEGEDEVGLHFDADYELEEQTTNLLLHPRVATVTYLSDYGAPTLILSQKSPPMDDLQKKTLEQGIDKAWLSHPQLGKHTAFDGRLLHGAPALYFPGRSHHHGIISQDDGDKKHAATDDDDGDQNPAPSKRQKVEQQADTKRYTLLVNVWLNHWVMDAGLLDDDVCAKLRTPWKNAEKHPFLWREAVDLAKPFTNNHNVVTVKLRPSNVDPAGEDEIALCNHNVTIKYNPTMTECHDASRTGTTVALELEPGAITLHVGGKLEEEEDGEDEE